MHGPLHCLCVYFFKSWGKLNYENKHVGFNINLKLMNVKHFCVIVNYFNVIFA